MAKTKVAQESSPVKGSATVVGAVSPVNTPVTEAFDPYWTPVTALNTYVAGVAWAANEAANKTAAKGSILFGPII
jgi:hypothetical protein